MEFGKRYKVLIAMALILGAILACMIIPPEAEREYSARYGEYIFNRTTIIESLSQGDLNVFFSLTEPQLPLPTPVDKPTEWSFSDFLDVAQAFHQWHWKEPMSEWNLNKLEYQVDCGNPELVPYFVWLELSRISRTNNGKEIRFAHTIQINLPKAVLYWSEAERRPVTEPWQSIDLTGIKIPAEKAIKIAEENGGQTMRLSVDNNCRIFVVAPDSLGNEWLVRYASYSSDDGWRYLLEVYVDKDSREFRIVYPK